MGESAEHIRLVQAIEQYVINLVPDGNEALLLSDLPDAREKPSQNDQRFRSDVRYCYESLLVIGEAKTSDDLSNIHTQSQIESYLLECDEFDGQSIFVLGVPVEDFDRAKNIIGSTQYRLGTKVCSTVINELGMASAV
jgi:hypothetical protein